MAVRWAPVSQVPAAASRSQALLALEDLGLLETDGTGNTILTGDGSQELERARTSA